MAKMLTMDKTKEEIKMTTKKFWFVIGSQELYGDDALKQVKQNAQDITDELNAKAELPFEIELQTKLAISADVITGIMKEANYRDDILGVITWMRSEEHTSELQSRFD